LGIIFESSFPRKPKIHAKIKLTKRLSNNTSAINPRIAKINIVSKNGIVKNKVFLDVLSLLISCGAVLEEPQ
jgi:hypothetical protein